MSGGVAEQPLARAILRHLAAARGEGDPLGSLARTVLSGEMTLRQAAASPWCGQGIAAAFEEAQQRHAEVTDEQRAEYERQAERLRQTEVADETGEIR